MNYFSGDRSLDMTYYLIFPLLFTSVCFFYEITFVNTYFFSSINTM